MWEEGDRKSSIRTETFFSRWSHGLKATQDDGNDGKQWNVQATHAARVAPSGRALKYESKLDRQSAVSLFLVRNN